tara:strand:+ start:131 stop:1057 length:927 start_codon:yes stop_codon:yes gene_type:complete
MIRIGTDCSGIEAPIQALQNLNIPFSHEFSSDIDKYCIQSIKANYEPKILFGDPDGAFPDGDITKRNVQDIPDIDMYICGFPCQPFSTAGLRNGFEHKSGNVFWSCLDVIRVKKPKYFILENVKGLLSNDKGKTWATILSELNTLEGYTVDWKILNTKDYGIPQHRPRLFIVGTKESFEWPEKSKVCKPLADFVDNHSTETHTLTMRHENYIKKLNDNAVFVDFGFASFDMKKKHLNSMYTVYSPCIVRENRMWCVPNHRRATCGELLALQGFPEQFIQVVSDSQIKKQAGNSMSVNVIEKIIKNLVD